MNPVTMFVIAIVVTLTTSIGVAAVSSAHSSRAAFLHEQSQLSFLQRQIEDQIRREKTKLFALTGELEQVLAPPKPTVLAWCAGCDVNHPVSEMVWTDAGLYRCRTCAHPEVLVEQAVSS